MPFDVCEASVYVLSSDRIRHSSQSNDNFVVHQKWDGRSMYVIRKIYGKFKGRSRVAYTMLLRGVPVGQDTYPEPSACEVGWPVLFLATFISPVLLLGEQ